jgi:hypothetical protein
MVAFRNGVVQRDRFVGATIAVFLEIFGSDSLRVCVQKLGAFGLAPRPGDPVINEAFFEARSDRSPSII